MSQIVTQVKDVSETTTHGATCRCGQTFPTTEDLDDHLAAHQTDLDAQDRSTREPTEDELIDLFNRYRTEMGYSRSQAAGIIRQSYYTVIEDYQTGCPGYVGRVLIEINGAGPECYTVYTWNDGTLRRHDRANGLHHAGGSQ